MKIGIDISRYIDKSGGVGIYAANLLKFLLKIDIDNKYLGYSFFMTVFLKGGIKEKMQEYLRIITEIPISIPTSG